MSRGRQQTANLFWQTLSSSNLPENPWFRVLADFFRNGKFPCQFHAMFEYFLKIRQSFTGRLLINKSRRKPYPETLSVRWIFVNLYRYNGELSGDAPLLAFPLQFNCQILHHIIGKYITGKPSISMADHSLSRYFFSFSHLMHSFLSQSIKRLWFLKSYQFISLPLHPIPTSSSVSLDRPLNQRSRSSGSISRRVGSLMHWPKVCVALGIIMSLCDIRLLGFTAELFNSQVLMVDLLARISNTALTSNTKCIDKELWVG